MMLLVSQITNEEKDVLQTRMSKTFDMTIISKVLKI